MKHLRAGEAHGFTFEKPQPIKAGETYGHLKVIDEAEIEVELAEEARQDRLAEEAYRELLEQPDIRVRHADEF